MKEVKNIIEQFLLIGLFANIWQWLWFSLYIFQVNLYFIFLIEVCLTIKNIYLSRTTWFSAHIHCEIICTIKLINISITSNNYYFLNFISDHNREV